MATDAEINIQGLARLTATTANPRSSVDVNDEWFTRKVTPYAYVDMRKHIWLCYWMGQGWIARPSGDAKKAYGLVDDNTYAGADDARGLIDLIEANIERDRQTASATAAASSFPWWLVALGLWAWSENKKGR